MTKWRDKKTGKIWTQQNGLTMLPGWWRDRYEVVVENEGVMSAEGMHPGDPRVTDELCKHGFSFCIDCIAEVRRELLNAVLLIDHVYATCGTTPGGCERPRGHDGECGVGTLNDWRRK